ncbi:MAG TPA: choice-of-anchor Q domain-containing protein [Rhodanobacteraceae bacterium]|jgi:hypothetical protein|nr:choice-of-anchor Q domain-containing protein [Rhodanobacteraceae bacterium]
MFSTSPTAVFDSQRSPARPSNQPEIRTVNTCADGGPGSLRTEIANASNGSTIDLTNLNCSVITLTLGSAIDVGHDVYLQGPGASSLTIDADHQSSVFYHTGNGTFRISGLTIANGYYVGSHPSGGCIYSAANVYLTGTTLTGCTVSSTNSTPARGGGVYTRGDLTLSVSTISGNNAVGGGLGVAQAFGGGAFASGKFASYYSSVINNQVSQGFSGHYAFGGGVAVGSSAAISGSTIAGNHAGAVGGIYLGTNGNVGNATISDSTISGNVADSRNGGIFTKIPLTMLSSTVAFNSAPTSGGFGFIGEMTLKNSIIADNVASSGQSDVDGLGSITGSNNLVTSDSGVMPQNTINACPHLDPLAIAAGGGTATHALRHSSPAVDEGGDPGSLVLDQRGAPRVVNGQMDIGSVELQPSDKDETLLANGFDGLCDQ